MPTISSQYEDRGNHIVHGKRPNSLWEYYINPKEIRNRSETLLEYGSECNGSICMLFSPLNRKNKCTRPLQQARHIQIE